MYTSKGAKGYFVLGMSLATDAISELENTWYMSPGQMFQKSGQYFSSPAPAVCTSYGETEDRVRVFKIHTE